MVPISCSPIKAEWRPWCRSRSGEHTSALFPYTTLFRSWSNQRHSEFGGFRQRAAGGGLWCQYPVHQSRRSGGRGAVRDRESTLLHSSPTRRSSDLGQTSVTVNLAASANALPAAVYGANILFTNQGGVAAVVPFEIGRAHFCTLPLHDALPILVKPASQ